MVAPAGRGEEAEKLGEERQRLGTVQEQEAADLSDLKISRVSKGGAFGTGTSKQEAEQGPEVISSASQVDQTFKPQGFSAHGVLPNNRLPHALLKVRSARSSGRSSSSWASPRLRTNSRTPSGTLERSYSAGSTQRETSVTPSSYGIQPKPCSAQRACLLLPLTGRPRERPRRGKSCGAPTTQACLRTRASSPRREPFPPAEYWRSLWSKKPGRRAPGEGHQMEGVVG